MVRVMMSVVVGLDIVPVYAHNDNPQDGAGSVAVAVGPAPAHAGPVAAGAVVDLASAAAGTVEAEVDDMPVPALAPEILPK